MLQTAIGVEDFRGCYSCAWVGVQKGLQFGYYFRGIGYIRIQYETVLCVTVGSTQCDIVRASIAQIAFREAIRNAGLVETVYIRGSGRVVYDANMGL